MSFKLFTFQEINRASYFSFKERGFRLLAQSELIYSVQTRLKFQAEETKGGFASNPPFDHDHQGGEVVPTLMMLG